MAVKKEKKMYLAKLTHEKESYERALQELERSAVAHRQFAAGVGASPSRGSGQAAVRFLAEGGEGRPPVAG